MPAKLNVKDSLDGNTLDLSLADLQDVPVRDIAAVKKGTILDLSNNRLVTLGKTFSLLTHLIELDLSNNLLRELPEDFGELSLLRRLDLYGNKLQHLPLSFSQLKVLKWLDLKGNPLVPRLAEIAGPCEENKDCEDCARNVVATLSKMVLDVEEEKKRRLREQLQGKEREEQELLAKKKKLEKATKKSTGKAQKVKAGGPEKEVTSSSAPPSPANKSSAKESASKTNAKPHLSKERPAKESTERPKKSQQFQETKDPRKKRDQYTCTPKRNREVASDNSVCYRLVDVLIWLFLFVLLVAAAIVLFVLWARPLFELLACKLGLEGGAIARYVLQKVSCLRIV